VEVPRIEYDKLSEKRLGESSISVRERVEMARDRQRTRFINDGGAHVTCNADMRPAELRKFCVLDETGQALMRTAMNQLQLSARGYHRVLKLARTISDLAESEAIVPAYLAEALQYRPRLNIL
jgi:magnesium chelatase family protein